MTTTWIDVQRQKHGPERVAEIVDKLTPQQLDNGGGDQDFALWLALVDNAMARTVGVGHRDIGDWTWRDAFDAGTRPTEAAREALEADDTYSLLFG
jgi:hypothetical protein